MIWPLTRIAFDGVLVTLGAWEASVHYIAYLPAKSENKQNFFIQFFHSTLERTSERLYALLLLIKSELASRSGDELSCFRKTSLVAKKKSGGTLLANLP